MVCTLVCTVLDLLYFILSQVSVTILASCQSPLTFMLQAGKVLDIISSLARYLWCKYLKISCSKFFNVERYKD